MPAGYSGTPLVRKLGIREGMRILTINVPGEYSSLVADLPEDLEYAAGDTAPVDMIHIFTTSRRGLRAQLRKLRSRIKPAGMIWVSWPKKASGVPTDTSEDAIRTAALEAGLVDVKVCAIDLVWSGLKLVIRRADRTPPGGSASSRG